MANDKPIKVDDYVLNTEGYVFQVKAIDGDMVVLYGVVTNNGASFNTKHVSDRRKAKLQKVSASFVTALKGTP